MSRARFSEELRQKIRDAVNILEVVGEHVVLRKTGANAVGLCPFHSERSPSFSVSETKGLYHCYGCKKSGDLFTFVMEIHGIGFPEAVEELAERARIALPNDWNGGLPTDDPETQARRREARERLHILFKLNLFAMAFYRQQLAQSAPVDRYFRSRGVQGDLAANFRVGAAPVSWDALARHMAEKKAPLAQAAELGLLRPSTRSVPGAKTGYFDLFRSRAMFPIIDMRGRVAGFGGRLLPGLPEAAEPSSSEDGPKYMNSPESPVFQKSKLAFGLFQAQKHIREKDEVILVEGYFDVLALHAAGFENAVATCGTALTPEHLALFRRFARRVTILFDGDKAGISATGRAMEIGLDHGQILYGASMPEGLDPDELLFDQATGRLLPDGKERMAAILGATQPLLAAQLQLAAAEAGQGPEARTQALKSAAGWLKRYTDPVGREVWCEEVLRRLGVSRTLLSQAMGLPARTGGTLPRPLQPRVQPLAQAAAKPLGSRDKILLQAFAKGGEYAQAFIQAGANLPPESALPDLFDYGPAREFIAQLLSEPGVLERFRAAPEMLLTGDLDPQVLSTLTEALVSQEVPLDQEDFKISLDKAIGRLWVRFSHRIKADLADAEAKQDAGLPKKLMQDYLDVQRKIKEFISFYDED